MSEPKATPTARPTVTIITTCKGRLHHLKRTLPTMAAEKPDELIVVDYSCPQQAGDWVRAHVPEARVVRNPGAFGFNIGRARNLGAAEASSAWMLFVDADVALKPGLVQALRSGVQQGLFYTPQPATGADRQLYGSFCCRTRDFASVGGYDEIIEGWGFEDHDLRDRLRQLGLVEAHYSASLLDPIPHDDSERSVRSNLRDRFHNEAINACYSKAKQAITIAKGKRGNLPLEERRNLMIECRQLVGDWYASGARQAMEFRFLVDRGKRVSLGTGMGVNLNVTVTVSMSPPRGAELAAMAERPAAARRRPPEAKPGARPKKASRAAKIPAAKKGAGK
jgi:glycosyltransferase involved in cell wall biosynthesis